MTGISAAEAMSLIQRQVPEMVRRVAPPPVKRFATVQSMDTSGLNAIVLVDGDSAPIEVVNAAGYLRASDRVVIDFYAPHGAIASALLGSQAPWGSKWGEIAEVSGGGAAFDASTPTQLTLSDVPMKAGRKYQITYRFKARCSVANTLITVRLQIDTGSGFATLDENPITFPLATGANTSESGEWQARYNAAEDQAPDLQIQCARVTGAAATTTPNLVILQVDDWGPA